MSSDIIRTLFRANGNFDNFKETVNIIEQSRGAVHYAIPPNFVVADVQLIDQRKIESCDGVVSSHTKRIDENKVATHSTVERAVIHAWNQSASTPLTSDNESTSISDQAWDSSGKSPPDLPVESKNDAEPAEFALMAQARSQIPTLKGRIGVGFVIVDSVHSEYQVNTTEEDKAIVGLIQGLSRLSDFEPNAGVQWIYDLRHVELDLAPSQFEGVEGLHREGIWRNAAMEKLGYAASPNAVGMYSGDLDQKYDTHHSFVIFCTRYPVPHFAYYREQLGWIVTHIDFGEWGIDRCDGVFAHEVAHAFGAMDEYSTSGCTCELQDGHLGIPNGNCANCSGISVSCLMLNHSMSLCHFTRGHLGWNSL